MRQTVVSPLHPPKEKHYINIGVRRMQKELDLTQGIATFFFRIPLSWLFSQIDPTSLFWMGFAPPLATLVSLLICFWYMRRRAGRR